MRWFDGWGLTMSKRETDGAEAVVSDDGVWTTGKTYQSKEEALDYEYIGGIDKVRTGWN